MVIVRKGALNELQLSGKNELRGGWATQPIDRLDPWLNRKHRTIDYFLPQLLIGLSGFQS